MFAFRSTQGLKLTQARNQETVCPVKGQGLGDLRKLPRWLGQIYDLDLVEYQTTLIRVLEAGSRQEERADDGA